MIGRGTFALVERSLRVDIRMTRTHLVRLLFAGIILIMMVQTHQQITWSQAPGRDFFTKICFLNFGLLNLAAMSFFSTAITEEKEEMTLGLLKMAGISPIGILLGKISPRLIAAILLLSVQLPFTFLAITLGGVLTNQILAAYLSLLAFAVLLAGIGGFFSTVCRRSNVSAALTASALALLYIGPMFCSYIALTASRRGLISSATAASVRWLTTCVSEATPWHSLSQIFQTGYAGGLFTYQVGIDLAVGSALFGLAWIFFEPCTRNEKPIAPARGLISLFRRRGGKNSVSHRVWNSPLAALAWKDFYFITGGLTAAGIKFASYALLMFGMSLLMAAQMRATVQDNIGALCMASMTIALLVEIPIYASRLFREEVRWQTWSNLVLLPEPVSRIAAGKILGTLPTFLPGLTILMAGAVLTPATFADWYLRSLDEIGFWYFISQYVFGVHLVVLLSLIVKWGSLPLGVAIVVMGNVLYFSCAAVVFNFGGGEEILIVPFGCSALGIFLTFFMVGERLRELASR